MNKNQLDQTWNEQVETLTAEQQQALLEKYDIESNTRTIKGIMHWVIFIGLLAFSIFQLYTAIEGQFTAYIQRSIHLGFALTFIFNLCSPALHLGPHIITISNLNSAGIAIAVSSLYIFIIVVLPFL